MPTYVYKREDGTTFELHQSIGEPNLDKCPETGQKVRRVIQPASIKFSGTGFHSTDYSGKNASL